MNATVARDLPSTMKAWRVETITVAGELHLRDVPLPVPVGDQVLVKVEVAGLNFLDTLVVKGQYQAKPALPFTPGVEVVGAIASGPRAGERVACSTKFGGFAEYVAVAESDVVPLAAGFPAGAALALRGNYPTSLYALRESGHLQAGETLLVHAGAGGVGSAAVQLGKLLGARVIATASSAVKLAACRELGADEVVDYSDSGWVDKVKQMAPEGVDMVYDPVGGEIGTQSLRCLAFNARYLIVGFAGGTLTQLAANRLLLRNASAIGVLWGAVRNREPLLASRLTEEIYGWNREGRLTPLAPSEFAFAQAPEALLALEGRRTAGKVLLVL
ncbi:MAG: alcohol dehydrogenase [Rhizobacter sp.]|nr:alcohol dehydrogenase [Rhizobacter sp.]